MRRCISLVGIAFILFLCEGAAGAPQPFTITKIDVQAGDGTPLVGGSLSPDGGRILFNGGKDIYNIDTGEVSGGLPASENPTGAAWDGTNIWYRSGDSIYVSQGGAGAFVVGQGSLVPGRGEAFDSVSLSSVDTSGAAISGNWGNFVGANRGVYFSNGGAPQKVVDASTEVPGFGNSQFFTDATLFGNQVAFVAPALHLGKDNGIFIQQVGGADDAIVKVADRFTQVPGGPDGANFNRFEKLSFADGTLSFWAQGGSFPGPGTISGLFNAVGGTPQLVLNSSGTTGPSGEILNFVTFSYKRRGSDLVFLASGRRTNNVSLLGIYYSSSGGPLEAVVRTGDRLDGGDGRGVAWIRGFSFAANRIVFTVEFDTDTGFPDLVTYLAEKGGAGPTPTSTPSPTPTTTATIDPDLDTDEDGLSDIVEIEGIDRNNDGTLEVDLAAMGADPMRKDIFVEVDYMVRPHARNAAGAIVRRGHSYKPSDRAMRAVMRAFANAPVSNPNGVDGINLHIDTGSNSTMNYATREIWGTHSRSNKQTARRYLGFKGAGGYNWNAFDARKNAHFEEARHSVFHYCISAHLLGNAGTTSGVSRGIEASDFIVSLGDRPTNPDMAGTFMHEFGHNLGLRHGGDSNVHHKPNYLSVMNYSFQRRGLIKNDRFHLDYSRFGPADLPALVESNLDERVGLNGSARTNDYGTRFFACDLDFIKARRVNDPIGWSCDLDQDDIGVMSDINESGSANETLTAFDDWPNLVYEGGLIGIDFIRKGSLPMETEIEELRVSDDESLGAEEFGVRVVGPGPVSLTAGSELDLSFTITNIGTMADDYLVSASTTQGWVDLGLLEGSAQSPLSLSLAAGETHEEILTLSIPDGLPIGAQDELCLFAQSGADPNISDDVCVEIEVNLEGLPTPAPVPASDLLLFSQTWYERDYFPEDLLCLLFGDCDQTTGRAVIVPTNTQATSTPTSGEPAATPTPTHTAARPLATFTSTPTPSPTVTPTVGSATKLGHWVFDQSGVSESTVTDLTGNHDATLFGTVELETDPESWSLDGSTTYATIPATVPDDLPARDITLEAWVRVDSSVNWAAAIGCIQDNLTFERGWVLGQRTSNFYFGLKTQDYPSLTFLQTTTPFSLMTWHHIVGTYDGTTQTIYLDGQPDNTSTEQSGDIHYAPAPYVLGRYEDDDETYRWNGAIREVLIYDGALSASEVLDRFESARDLFAPSTGTEIFQAGDGFIDFSVAADGSPINGVPNPNGVSPGSSITSQFASVGIRFKTTRFRDESVDIPLVDVYGGPDDNYVQGPFFTEPGRAVWEVLFDTPVRRAGLLRRFVVEGAITNFYAEDGSLIATVNHAASTPFASWDVGEGAPGIKRIEVTSPDLHTDGILGGDNLFFSQVGTLPIPETLRYGP